jgi:hypothetical protein
MGNERYIISHESHESSSYQAMQWEIMIIYHIVYQAFGWLPDMMIGLLYESKE